MRLWGVTWSVVVSGRVVSYISGRRPRSRVECGPRVLTVDTLLAAMNAGMTWCVVAASLAAVACAERWNWPDPIGDLDFPLTLHDQDQQTRLIDEVPLDLPFQQATNTGGFYNRPAGEGRYTVRIEEPRRHHKTRGVSHARRSGGRQLAAVGTLESVQQCKCMPIATCPHRSDATTENKACGANQNMCCFPPTPLYPSSQLFNGLDGPGIYSAAPSADGAYPPTGGRETQHAKVGQQGIQKSALKTKEVLVGTGGPTIFGANKPKLYGNEAVPKAPITARPTLVGPLVPTGVVAPAIARDNYLRPDLSPSESAQRGVLAGPGGPTGMIGPSFYNRPALTGHGGPRGRYPLYRGGLLVGPDGPSGPVGPSRGILTGPGGPTGHIGPWGYGN